MLLIDQPRPTRDDALLGHELLWFVSLAAYVLDAAYEGNLAEDLVDINHPGVCHASVSIKSLPHRGVTKLFPEGSRRAKIDLAEGAGEVTFVHVTPKPGAQGLEFVSVYREGTEDKQLDGFHRLDMKGPFEWEWNTEIATPLGLVGLNALTRAVHERLDV